MSIDISRRGRVAVLALNRPPVNAFSRQQIDAVIAEFTRLETDDSCSAVVITGSNSIFSAGIDIGMLAGVDAAALRDIIRGLNKLVYAVYRCSRPVVAAVPGHAVGLGAVLMLCCDFRILAAGDYRVGLNELDAGLAFPAGPAALVRAELSPGAARYLCLGAGLYGPESPQLRELVDEVVPPDALLDRAIALAKDRGAQAIYAAVKYQLRAKTLADLQCVAEQDQDPLLAQADQLVERLAQLAV